MDDYLHHDALAELTPTQAEESFVWNKSTGELHYKWVARLCNVINMPRLTVRRRGDAIQHPQCHARKCQTH